ncbi:hypothetical protein ACFCYB_00010 [Streptomyces sp. NPDC056309]|uniref:hypothetical protein n=1 Tax=Streptomyces sp. NPDC056309 TaxID=3345781 RepID=UPI0035D603F2
MPRAVPPPRRASAGGTERSKAVPWRADDPRVARPQHKGLFVEPDWPPDDEPE